MFSLSPWLNQGVEAFQRLEEVDCLVLGGSRATAQNDQNSDYDMYVYANKELPVETRKAILEPLCSYIELNNTYWETEDDCILKDGNYFEIIYRNLMETENNLHSTLIDGNAGMGYTTCICYNVFTAKVLYDPKNLYQALVEKYAFPYPEALAQNIIIKNRPLLGGLISSYDRQIEKAVARKDFVSVNHRIAAFLASYFDIIFALNRLYHPGEKRLVSYCLKHCQHLPTGFEQDICALSLATETTDFEGLLQKIINNLDVLLAQQKAF